MKKLIQFIIVLLLVQSSVFGQSNLNDFKYILIPKQYDFQRSDDQYQLNSLTKFLFNKYGFEAYFENEDIPSDVSQDRCLALRADLKKLKGFLITRLQFELQDCNGNIVSASKVGETKVKQYDKAYNIALRQAFETYQNANYSYQPKTKATPVVVTSNKVEDAVVTTSESTSEVKEEVIEDVKSEVETKSMNTAESKASEVQETVKVQPDPEPIKEVDKSWYASPIDNGYKVLDANKSTVMTLLYSGATDVYMVKDKNAIVFKKDGYWMYSSNDGNGIKVNRIDLKF